MMTKWQGQGDGDCVRTTLKLALRDIEGEVHYVRASERAALSGAQSTLDTVTRPDTKEMETQLTQWEHTTFYVTHTSTIT